jgi:hypothetical protein
VNRSGELLEKLFRRDRLRLAGLKVGESLLGLLAPEFVDPGVGTIEARENGFGERSPLESRQIKGMLKDCVKVSSPFSTAILGPEPVVAI